MGTNWLRNDMLGQAEVVLLSEVKFIESVLSKEFVFFSLKSLCGGSRQCVLYEDRGP